MNEESCELAHGLATTILLDKSCAIELTLTESTASVSSDDCSNGSNFDSPISNTSSNRTGHQKHSTKKNRSYVRRPMFHCMQVAVDEANAAAGWLCRSQSLTDEECYTSFISESYDDLDDWYDSSLSFDYSFEDEPHYGSKYKHSIVKLPELADFSTIFGGSLNSVTSGDETDTVCNPRQKRSRPTKKKASRSKEATIRPLHTELPKPQALVAANNNFNTIQQLAKSRKRYNDFVHRTLLPRLSRMAKEYIQGSSRQNIPNTMFPVARCFERPYPLTNHRLICDGCSSSSSSTPEYLRFLPVGKFGSPSSNVSTDLRQTLHAIVELAQFSNKYIIQTWLPMAFPYQAFPMISYSRNRSEEDAVNHSCTKQRNDPTQKELTIAIDPVKAIRSSVSHYFHARSENKVARESSIADVYEGTKSWSDDELKEIMCSSTKQVFQSLSDLPSFSDPSTTSWDTTDDDGLDSEMDALGMISENLRRELDDAVKIPSFCVEPQFTESRTEEEEKKFADLATNYEQVSDYCRFEMDELRSAAAECWKGLHEWTRFQRGV